MRLQPHWPQTPEQQRGARSARLRMELNLISLRAEARASARRPFISSQPAASGARRKRRKDAMMALSPSIGMPAQVYEVIILDTCLFSRLHPPTRGCIVFYSLRAASRRPTPPYLHQEHFGKLSPLVRVFTKDYLLHFQLSIHPYLINRFHSISLSHIINLFHRRAFVHGTHSVGLRDAERTGSAPSDRRPPDTSPACQQHKKMCKVLLRLQLFLIKLAALRACRGAIEYWRSALGNADGAHPGAARDRSERRVEARDVEAAVARVAQDHPRG
jgi:hypothetical protein